MKANEFVKKFGWKKVKHCTKPTSRDNFFIVCGEVIRDQDLIDLKRLVESHELVEKVGGMGKANMLLRMRIAAELYESADEIEQAIADVESCQ